MLRLLTITVVAATLLPAALGLVSACSEPMLPGTDAAVAQERFRTNYCYKQYRSQADVTRCLSKPV